MYPGLEVLALTFLSKERAQAYNQELAEAFSKPSPLAKFVKQVRMFLF